MFHWNVNFWFSLSSLFHTKWTWKSENNPPITLPSLPVTVLSTLWLISMCKNRNSDEYFRGLNLFTLSINRAHNSVLRVLTLKLWTFHTTNGQHWVLTCTTLLLLFVSSPSNSSLKDNVGANIRHQTWNHIVDGRLINNKPEHEENIEIISNNNNK